MHVNWSVDVSALVTWAISIGSAIWCVATLVAKIGTLKTNQDELHAAFISHDQSDDRRFQRIDDLFLQIKDSHH